MTHAVQLRLRCPACDSLGRDTMIGDGLFVCPCGTSRPVRDPSSLGSPRERWSAANELRRAARIDLPTAYSVLLELIPIDRARGTQVVHVDAPPTQTADPARATTQPRIRSLAPPVAEPPSSQLRMVLVASVAGVLLAGMMLVLSRSAAEITNGPPERVHISSTTLMRTGSDGAPVEIRAADPAEILRRYCRATGCRALGLAMPPALGGRVRLGLFETEAGVPAAIRIERRSSVEWSAGRGTEPIEIVPSPALPPRTPTIRLSR